MIEIMKNMFRKVQKAENIIIPIMKFISYLTKSMKGLVIKIEIKGVCANSNQTTQVEFN